MLWYCLKHRKNTESKNPEVAKAKNEKNVYCGIVKNRNLSNSKKLEDYLVG